MSDVASGERRTDHRAYAASCPREGCKAPPWRACTTWRGASSPSAPVSLAKPHAERIAAAKGTSAKERTPTFGPMFEDPMIRVVVRAIGHVSSPIDEEDCLSDGPEDRD